MTLGRVIRFHSVREFFFCTHSSGWPISYVSCKEQALNGLLARKPARSRPNRINFGPRARSKLEEFPFCLWTNQTFPCEKNCNRSFWDVIHIVSREAYEPVYNHSVHLLISLPVFLCSIRCKSTNSAPYSSTS
jgi:hypothetical protein